MVLALVVGKLSFRLLKQMGLFHKAGMAHFNEDIALFDSKQLIILDRALHD